MTRPDTWTSDDEYLLYWCRVDLAQKQADRAADTARLAGFPVGSTELRAMETAAENYKQVRRCYPGRLNDEFP